MGSKKIKGRPTKRKLDEGTLKKVEVSTPKKRCDEEVEVPAGSPEEEIEILPTRQSLAEQLCVAIRQKEFTLIEGPLGCGKSYLGVCIAKKLQLKLAQMQMGDQVDSKSIFGSYQCTEVAGQFKWKQSNFTQWLIEDSLILIEDIDLANSDVISIFIQIAKARQIRLPSGELVPFHEKARLIATTSGKGKKNSILDGISVKVHLNDLSDAELKRLIKQSYPRCGHITKELLKIFRELQKVSGTGNSRVLTSSDLLRGCARLNRLIDLSINTDVFAELVDCWCLSELPDRARNLCQMVAANLQVKLDQMEFHMGLRQPELTHDDYFCKIGRCQLARCPSLKIVQHYKLGHTRDVLQLMERIAVCVRENESVLLVGETGVGKTSVVQVLASSLNIELKVVNLSPTSDSDELLEGYKPTTIGNLLEPFTKFYYEVFTAHLDAKQNKKFLDSLETCLNTGRYRDYLSLTEKTAQRMMREKTAVDPRWAEIVVRARKIRDGIEKNAVPFAITRGAVLEAVQNGHWLLVDEINLAPPECLDAIVHAISSHAHPNFRLFACMNPATDAGKRRLPTSVRTRFTEFYVAEMTDPHQLALVVNAYLPSMKVGMVEKIVKFYLEAKKMYPSSYSLRTFCRSLLFAGDNLFGSEERSVYEAISMAFLTNLDSDDKIKMKTKIQQIFKVSTSVGIPPPTANETSQQFVKIENYWIECGKLLPKIDENYVLTKTVKENLADIARIVCSGRFPILLEGETSAGKTAIVTYLGKITGNEVIRINNHEHTDIQEYMGSYVAGEEGRLVFAEGPLVKAVRNGTWVILDELNLAPTDVIESLNRLLDDNRELFIPELNTTIKAHPRFRLFATQNPAGTYSGRKRLSRALLSRFVVLKFHHLPMNELAEMVHIRCKVPPTAAQNMIAVLVDLRSKRSLSGLFSARDGLMTLRDVFRWAKRLAMDPQADWRQVLVDHGYFLLAGRCRNRKDELTVIETLEKVLKNKVNQDSLFTEESQYFPKDLDTSRIILTYGMRRMIVLTEQAWKHNEAVLMVGETGGGKTSMAETMGKGRLLTINCHERTETADLLGRLRPRDGGGFEWSDGVVITAMRAGLPLLVDEISLAEDSVLERLNPLFEDDRSLLLSDAGVEVHSVAAKKGYQMIATMNPGGDYGKKELSKALRNRFTEVWSSSDYKEHELVSIFDSRVNSSGTENPSSAGRAVVSWISEFFEKYSHVFRHAPSVRDIVACAELYGSMLSRNLSEFTAVKEALSAVFLDALESLPTRMAVDVEAVLEDANRILHHLLNNSEPSISSPMCVQIFDDRIIIDWVDVSYGCLTPSKPKAFSLKAPTCVKNFYRIARALLINKPILLEGPPGSGKSSTVMALAQLTGNPITRLNLSDQTDLTDLFGSDVPVILDDGSISFRWEDGPVLRAIKNGEWILLDEMNLASQSVLEGLNACFDHRRILYIAELNKSFEIPSDNQCRFFACQNPRAQGGNRRALPKSFVNRFTSIWVDDMTKDDVVFILQEVDKHNVLTHTQIHAMVEITHRLSQDHHLHGGPFTFNLRDLLRWLQLYSETKNMAMGFHLLFVSRLRKEEDREKLCIMYKELFAEPCVAPPMNVFADPGKVVFGTISLPRTSISSNSRNCLLASQACILGKLAASIKMHWLTLLVGPRGCGKTSTIENLAQICGVRLEKLCLTSETDAQELIGSYEQIVDETAIEKAKTVIIESLLGNVEDNIIKKLNTVTDLLQLEIVTEMALSQIEKNSIIIEKCRQILQWATRADMRFSWVDSAFVRAFVDGHWIVIENVNMCSAAVLDRLNSCLESDGKLVISERQSSFEPLEPHKNFRIFLTMDPHDGEISRAMRNRSVEIFVDKLWYKTESDIATLADLSGQVIPKQILEALPMYPLNIQLQFCVLLREMRIEEVCRALNILFERDAQSNTNIIKCLEVSEIDTPQYLEWIIKQWRVEEGNVLDRLFLCCLTASSQLFKHPLFQQIFGILATRFTERISPILDNWPLSAIPMDERVLGKYNIPAKHLPLLQRFVIIIVFEWTLLSVESTELSTGSAEYLSRTLTKYEMSNNPRRFTNLQLIAKLNDCIERVLKEGGIYGPEDAVFRLCLSLFLLVKTTRTGLTPRSGPAPIYLAWNYIEKMESLQIEHHLTDIMAEMKAGWTAEDYKQFVTVYMKIYENNRFVNAFENEDECQAFQISIAPQEALMETDESEEIRLSSPLIAAVQLVEKAELILSFMKCFKINKDNSVFQAVEPLKHLKWTDRRYDNYSCMLTVLNANMDDDCTKVMSLYEKGSFSYVYSSFWKSLNFDINMSSLVISDLQEFSLTSFLAKLWRFAANGSFLDSTINDKLSAISQELEKWSTSQTSGWKGRLEVAMENLKLSMPPKNTIDPVIYEEEKINHLMSKLDLVDRQLEILGQWREGVTMQDTDCDLNSKHPIITALFSLREELLQELDACVASENPVYRQSANLYAFLCDEMHDFYNRAKDVANKIIGLDITALKNFREIQLNEAQLKTFVISATSFKQSMLAKCTSFVDISIPFLIAVEALLSSVHEVSSQLQIAAKIVELQGEASERTNFPLVFHIQNSAEGAISPELMIWSCRDGSTMPLRLKAALIRKRILEKTDPLVDLEWSRREWRKWYERNVAKCAEKEYAYREKTEEQKEELDIVEFFTQMSYENEVLPADDVCLLLNMGASSAKTLEVEAKEAEARYNMALIWIRHLLTTLHKLRPEYRNSSLMPDLQMAQWMSDREKSSIGILDVYRSASTAEFRKAVNLLNALVERTKVILERWPEVVTLKLILDAVNTFLTLSITVSHAKISVVLENILEQCEEWEKLADRENSLREQLAPLRVLLVEWKKMEIKSWSHLLNRTESDAHLSSQLVAFPLFDAMFKAETAEARSNIVAMSAEWIHNGTLLDFPARLYTVQRLAEWANMLGYNDLPAKLTSLAAHFEQYSSLVEKSCNEQRMVATQNLDDYIKIIKYNDLNLYNIKVQSQKTHAHLFKIVKKYKADTLSEASVHFDKLLEIDSCTIDNINISLSKSENAHPRVRRAHELSETLIRKVNEICDMSKTLDLREQISQCDDALRTMINYDQYEEDEAKEKAQGYARNSRQRNVAMVIKEAQAIGLNARKAVTLNQEAITQDSITNIPVKSDREEIIRICAGGRNVAIKKSNSISNQVGIATRKHFSGVIEYGMSWMLKVHSYIHNFSSSSKYFHKASYALQTLQRNIENHRYFDHERMQNRIETLLTKSSQILTITKAMKTRIAMVPQLTDIDESGAAFLHPLSLLHSEHPELNDLKSKTAHIFELANSADETVKEWKKSGVTGLFDGSSVDEIEQRLNSYLTGLKTSAAELEKWFDNECTQVSALAEDIQAQNTNGNIGIIFQEIDIEPVLMYIQSIYKFIIDKEDWDGMKTIDRYEIVSKSLVLVNTSKVHEWLHAIISKAAVGILPTNISEIVSLAKLISQLSSAFLSIVSSVLQSVAILYYRILSLTIQLFEKGYVNTIPKDGKQETGDGKTDEAGEGGGMGEGKAGGDAKDVTDEMEETGQIEGLQDEEQEPPSGQTGENEKPIEMDEDFAEDLQDIDKNEKGTDEPDDDNEDPEEEPEPEDQLGDVDNADDTQLDPKLWDEEEKDDERKDMDQDDAGADNKTDQMAAKEDDPLTAQQETPEDCPAAENEEQNDDVENVDEREKENDTNDQNQVDPEIANDQIDQSDDEGGEEINMDENMEVDDDEENENEPVEGSGEEEENKEEEISEMNENPGETKEEKQEDNAEAMEQGTGGERRDEADQNEGGLNEDKQDDDEKMNEEGKGESKSDRKGEKGQGAEAKKKEDDLEGNDEDDADEAAQKDRQIATDDNETIEANEGQGEENDAGQMMEDSATAQQQMHGAGSMEEARKSKREERTQENAPKKKPLPGVDEMMDVPVEEGEDLCDEAQAAIHLAPEDLFQLAEDLTTELILGSSQSGSVEEKSETIRADEKFTTRAEAEKMWTEISRSVNILSAELAENLRLILEPQRASKMQGDYRTGKRLNMRRLIPYIASEYRKDRIWMRRTKKAQREYQVLIAVDDSASMNENGIHQVTCESVCTIDDALRRCDAGAVSVVSFGSKVKTICSFGEQIIPGPDFIEKLTFNQASTDLLGLLNTSRTMLADVRTPTSEQLLIIISDGRGALAQGADKIKQAVASLQSVTVLFVILDSGSKSISELTVASFKGGSVILTPYLSLFPFPFYAVVKTVRQLPSVLAESIRQWFEVSMQSI